MWINEESCRICIVLGSRRNADEYAAFQYIYRNSGYYYMSAFWIFVILLLKYIRGSYKIIKSDDFATSSFLYRKGKVLFIFKIGFH